MLPPQLAAEIVGILLICECLRVWPLQWLCNLWAFLPKPSSGERAVAKTPMLYRVWCRWRRLPVTAWESTNARPWDCAVAGKGVFSSALLRAWKTELALAQGVCAGAALWDLSEFFDTVVVETLAEKLACSTYPADLAALALQMHLAPM